MGIRNAQLEDIGSIIDLLDQLGYTSLDDFLPSRLTSLLGNPNHYLLIHQTGEAINGFIAMYIIPELGLNYDTALITYLVVNDNKRGEGIGKHLEAACIAIAKNRGCGRIQLHCSSKRTAAHRFYESLGYQEWPKYFSKFINK